MILQDDSKIDSRKYDSKICIKQGLLYNGQLKLPTHEHSNTDTAQ